MSIFFVAKEKFSFITLGRNELGIKSLRLYCTSAKPKDTKDAGSNLEELSKTLKDSELEDGCQYIC